MKIVKLFTRLFSILSFLTCCSPLFAVHTLKLSLDNLIAGAWIIASHNGTFTKASELEHIRIERNGQTLYTSDLHQNTIDFKAEVANGIPLYQVLGFVDNKMQSAQTKPSSPSRLQIDKRKPANFQPHRPNRSTPRLVPPPFETELVSYPDWICTRDDLGPPVHNGSLILQPSPSRSSHFLHPYYDPIGPDMRWDYHPPFVHSDLMQPGHFSDLDSRMDRAYYNALEEDRHKNFLPRRF